ncbi:unnamed protein product [Ectocarpus sp. 13 AM-2016]
MFLSLAWLCPRPRRNMLRNITLVGTARVELRAGSRCPKQTRLLELAVDQTFFLLYREKSRAGRPGDLSLIYVRHARLSPWERFNHFLRFHVSWNRVNSCYAYPS